MGGWGGPGSSQFWAGSVGLRGDVAEGAGPPPDNLQGREVGAGRPGFPSLWVARGCGPWGGGVSCSRPLSLLSRLDLSLLLQTVVPGLRQGLAESRWPINCTGFQNPDPALHGLPSPFPSVIASDPHNSYRWGRSNFNPILQMRKLRLTERK